MRQKEHIGGGLADDEKYTTWEFKECPGCGRKVVEYYSAVVVNDEEEILIKECIKLKLNPYEVPTL